MKKRKRYYNTKTNYLASGFGNRERKMGEREHNRINLNLQFLLICVMELNNCRITIVAMISVCVFI